MDEGDLCSPSGPLPGPSGADDSHVRELEAAGVSFRCRLHTINELPDMRMRLTLISVLVHPKHMGSTLRETLEQYAEQPVLQLPTRIRQTGKLDFDVFSRHLGEIAESTERHTALLGCEPLDAEEGEKIAYVRGYFESQNYVSVFHFDEGKALAMRPPQESHPFKLYLCTKDVTPVFGSLYNACRELWPPQVPWAFYMVVSSRLPFNFTSLLPFIEAQQKNAQEAVEQWLMQQSPTGLGSSEGGPGLDRRNSSDMLPPKEQSIGGEEKQQGGGSAHSTDGRPDREEGRGARDIPADTPKAASEGSFPNDPSKAAALWIQRAFATASSDENLNGLHDSLRDLLSPIFRANLLPAVDWNKLPLPCDWLRGQPPKALMTVLSVAQRSPVLSPS